MPAALRARLPITTEWQKQLRIHPVGLLNVGATLAWFGTAIACARPATWPLELANHLHVFYLWALVPVAVLCAVTRRTRFALFHSLFIVINLSVIAPAWFGSGEATSSAVAMRFVLLNVGTDNIDHERVLDLLREEQPDVAVVLEVDKRWMRALRTLHGLYPYVHAAPRSDNFGIAVLSRRPLSRARTYEFTPPGPPSVVATTTVNDRTVHFVATHPIPPVRAGAMDRRDAHLRALGDYLHAQVDPIVLVGDLNTSPWAPAFRVLLETAGLTDPRRGRGVLATWPSWVPVIAIDHVLVSPQLRVTSLRVGASIGSDHLPLFARVQFR